MLQHHAIVTNRARSLAVRWSGHGRDLQRGVHAQQGKAHPADSGNATRPTHSGSEPRDMVLSLVE